MAFRKTLADRFLHVARTCSWSHLRSNPARKAPPEPDIRRSFAQSSSSTAAAGGGGLSSAGNSLLLDRIRILNPDRIRLDGILNPNPSPSPNRMSAAEVRKVLRAAQVEAARARLRATGRHCVPYEDFLGICREVSSSEQGSEIARSLDESGTVVVLGNLVFLRPDQIARVIESVIPLSLPQQEDDGREEELRGMEEKKAVIDRQAEAGVRRELWGGLGFLVVQTVGFMRLTFWELSWDVMEPICFYVTSIYFMAGYSFFLRTSREPSFEGFFQSRLAAKQRRLMKAYNFDLCRFNQLKSACVVPSSSPPLHEIASSSSSSSHCDCCSRRDVQFCAAHY